MRARLAVATMMLVVLLSHDVAWSCDPCVGSTFSFASERTRLMHSAEPPIFGMTTFGRATNHGCLGLRQTDLAGLFKEPRHIELIGPLGMPFGTVFSITARGACYMGKFEELPHLVVESIDGHFLPAPTRVAYQFLKRPDSKDWPELGERFTCRVYADGGMRGLPSEVPYAGSVSHHGYVFLRWLRIVEITKREPAEPGWRDDTSGWRNVARRSSQPFTGADLKGPLGVRLGKVVTVDAVVHDRKSPGLKRFDWVRVASVEDVPLLEPRDLRVEFDSRIFGDPDGIAPRTEWDEEFKGRDLKPGEVVRLKVYTAGAMTGTPAAIGNSKDEKPYGFETWLVIVDDFVNGA